jgi:CO/xanthine dehydrogenase FAD-binding subunit
VKPSRFEYVRASAVEEAVAVLAEHGDDAKVLAGGQSLVPLLNMRLAAPAVLVDVNPVAGLDEIRPDNGSVHVGSLVRQAACERSPVVRARLPLVAECLPSVGHFVTRNRGTVGGSLAHADAKAELPLALLCLGGAAVARSLRGERTVPAEELSVTHFTTSLAPDELLVDTIWPAAGDREAFAFEEFALRAGDYAIAMAGCAIRGASARVAVAGPFEAPYVFDAGDPAEAAETARAAAEPRDSLHASAAYQRHLVGLLAARVVQTAMARGQTPSRGRTGPVPGAGPRLDTDAGSSPPRGYPQGHDSTDHVPGTDPRTWPEGA